MKETPKNIEGNEAQSMGSKAEGYWPSDCVGTEGGCDPSAGLHADHCPVSERANQEIDSDSEK
jgi:hypothetical protein